jgi:DNA-binding IclR family transcriptional regulator
VLATLAISGPAYRMDEEKIASFVTPLLGVTRQISTDLGFRGA